MSRVVSTSETVNEAMKVARKITTKSRPSVMMVKECVNETFESSLEQGLKYERRIFHAAFATKDQKEGMTAFAEKRKAEWSHE